jgi:hypothetical protein
METEEKIIADCCKNCEHYDEKVECAGDKRCPAWLAWFSQEWQNIRKAAARLKEKSRSRD